MIKCHFVDTSEVFDPETGAGCDGGYGHKDTMEIFIEHRLAGMARLETILHEAIELYCTGRIRHSRINNLAKDIATLLIDCGYVRLE
jgi:hypothetical protein